MTPSEYMELADRTNKDGNDIEMNNCIASALVTRLPDMIEAALAADRIKASLCYGAKLKELQHIECDATNAEGWQKEMTHAALGIFSEGGEILEIFHAAYFNGVDIDKVHMAEELGDLLWFIALMAKNIDYSIEDLMKMNIQKLASRYPDEYSDCMATNRDLEAEREALETKTS